MLLFIVQELKRYENFLQVLFVKFNVAPSPRSAGKQAQLLYEFSKYDASHNFSTDWTIQLMQQEKVKVHEWYINEERKTSMAQHLANVSFADGRRSRSRESHSRDKSKSPSKSVSQSPSKSKSPSKSLNAPDKKSDDESDDGGGGGGTDSNRTVSHPVVMNNNNNNNDNNDQNQDNNDNNTDINDDNNDQNTQDTDNNENENDNQQEIDENTQSVDAHVDIDMDVNKSKVNDSPTDINDKNNNSSTQDSEMTLLDNDNNSNINDIFDVSNDRQSVEEGEIVETSLVGKLNHLASASERKKSVNSEFDDLLNQHQHTSKITKKNSKTKRHRQTNNKSRDSKKKSKSKSHSSTKSKTKHKSNSNSNGNGDRNVRVPYDEKSDDNFELQYAEDINQEGDQIFNNSNKNIDFLAVRCYVRPDVEHPQEPNHFIDWPYNNIKRNYDYFDQYQPNNIMDISCDTIVLPKDQDIEVFFCDSTKHRKRWIVNISSQNKMHTSGDCYWHARPINTPRSETKLILNRHFSMLPTPGMYICQCVNVILYVIIIIFI